MLTAGAWLVIGFYFGIDLGETGVMYTLLVGRFLDTLTYIIGWNRNRLRLKNRENESENNSPIG